METDISQRLMRRIIHKDIQLKCLKKRCVQELTASNRASMIKHLISGEIVITRLSKPKANTLNIRCNVFAHNCQFAMTFNACITVVVNRTHAVFHKVA